MTPKTEPETVFMFLFMSKVLPREVPWECYEKKKKLEITEFTYGIQVKTNPVHEN